MKASHVGVAVSLLDVITCALGGMVLLWISTLSMAPTTDEVPGCNIHVELRNITATFEGGQVMEPDVGLRLNVCLVLSGEALVPEDSGRSVGGTLALLAPNHKSATSYRITTSRTEFGLDDRLLIFISESHRQLFPREVKATLAIEMSGGTATVPMGGDTACVELALGRISRGAAVPSSINVVDAHADN